LLNFGNKKEAVSKAIISMRNPNP